MTLMNVWNKNKETMLGCSAIVATVATIAAVGEVNHQSVSKIASPMLSFVSEEAVGNALGSLSCLGRSEGEIRSNNEISNDGKSLLISFCRAWDRHSIFYGPTLAQLVQEETPTAGKPGSNWTNAPIVAR